MPEDLRLERIADIQKQISAAQRRLSTIEGELKATESDQLRDGAITGVLADFDQVWDALKPREQARIH